MEQKKSSQLLGDISGGISTAIAGIPMSMAFGALIFSSLGNEYAAQGVIAGFYGTIFLCIVSSLFGSTPGLISVPQSLPTLILATTFIGLQEVFPIDSNDPSTLVRILTLGFLTVLLSGAIQLILGVFRLGNPIKYIPFPVLAGLYNGAALIIIFNQLGKAFGIPDVSTLGQFLSHLDEAQFMAVLVAVFTGGSMFIAKRFKLKIPDPLMGLVVGITAFYLLGMLGFAGQMGGIIGEIPTGIPKPEYAVLFLNLAFESEWLKALPIIILGSLNLALVNTMSSFFVCTMVEDLTNKPAKSYRELIAQGLGNIVTACFGGIPGSGNVKRTLTNIKAGGKTPLSGVICSLFTLLAISILAPLVSRIPLVVIAAILITIGIQTLDVWTLDLIRKLTQSSSRGKSGEVLVNISIVSVVMIVMVTIGLFPAFGLGICLSIFYFLYKMSKSSLRRFYNAHNVRSRMVRPEAHNKILNLNGNTIGVFELEGTIFFGSADSVSKKVLEQLEGGLEYVILDLMRVNEMDSTAARILQQLHKRLDSQGKQLILSHVQPKSYLWNFMDDLGVIKTIGEKNIYSDTDHALEKCEELILKTHLKSSYTRESYPIEILEILESLKVEEIKTGSQNMAELEKFEKGECVFKEGDVGDRFYAILKGTASENLPVPDKSYSKRIVTFGPGTFFGEMILFDPSPRTASIYAVEPLTCLSINVAEFERIQESNPELTYKILFNMSKGFVHRISHSNEIIRNLMQ
ncbi:MAG: SLC26A/SulP transporter family protein [Nitrospina sp.]|jgi:sulfate permease, SulP family|nr:SLC26A/SulP transporter family protein [Nitrospina sp.]MBT3509366.1 SLC26A/SulP transporter family protein [Nitrospina sp.]MBT3876160.1 SLC26A/SulP transporter family protein [Nitrospina sp.]MBT4048917.1 SLC26A/SulP transporter family protein [Nitrospina sp.]MBT4557740.1 SLC26A/SulP transporter family protein [Nitrospina sp.]